MKLEVLSPPPAAGGFTLGRDLLGFGKLGTSGDTWNDLLPVATGYTATRGGSTAQLNALDVGTLSVPLLDLDPATDSRLTPGRRVRLVADHREGSPVLWYGRITTPSASDDGAVHTYATLPAVDAVGDISNATSAGIGVDGKNDSLPKRIEQLAKVATVPIAYALGAPTAPGPIETTVVLSPATWEPFAPNGVSYTATAGDSGSRSLTVNESNAWGSTDVGFRRTITGLTIGRRYTLRIKTSSYYTSSSSGRKANRVVCRLDDDTTLVPAARNVNDLSTTVFDFVATATTALAVVTVGKADGEHQLRLVAPELNRHKIDPMLQPHVVKANVREHLNIACDSISGAAWRPTLGGAIEVIRQIASTPVATIYDTPPATPPAHSCSYLSINRAYASETTVNDVELTNVGRKSNGDANDTVKNYTSPASINTYGRFSLSVTTCLATTADRETRGAQIATERDTPKWWPTTVTYRTDDLDVLPDLLQTVQVRRKGTAYLCLVVGISYTERPEPNKPKKNNCTTTLVLRPI